LLKAERYPIDSPLSLDYGISNGKTFLTIKSFIDSKANKDFALTRMKASKTAVYLTGLDLNDALGWLTLNNKPLTSVVNTTDEVIAGAMKKLDLVSLLVSSASTPSPITITNIVALNNSSGSASTFHSYAVSLNVANTPQPLYQYTYTIDGDGFLREVDVEHYENSDHSVSKARTGEIFTMLYAGSTLPLDSIPTTGSSIVSAQDFKEIKLNAPIYTSKIVDLAKKVNRSKSGLDKNLITEDIVRKVLNSSPAIEGVKKSDILGGVMLSQGLPTSNENWATIYYAAVCIRGSKDKVVVTNC
jgi:hypothetical protein